jgi:hypothetical protein
MAEINTAVAHALGMSRAEVLGDQTFFSVVKTYAHSSGDAFCNFSNANATWDLGMPAGGSNGSIGTAWASFEPFADAWVGPDVVLRGQASVSASAFSQLNSAPASAETLLSGPGLSVQARASTGGAAVVIGWKMVNGSRIPINVTGQNGAVELPNIECDFTQPHDMVFHVAAGSTAYNGTTVMNLNAGAEAMSATTGTLEYSAED